MPITRASPSLITVRRTADSAARNSGNTGDTLTNDTQLLFAVGANEVWWFSMFLFVNAANATMDYKIAWSLPSGATALWGDTISTIWTPVITSAAPSAMPTHATVIPRGSGALTTGFSAHGAITNGSTAGNAVVQWAQNTADAGDLKLLANSVLILHRLA